ncbi:MAG: hypothetical protein ACTSUJ_08995 [Candidatus Njordarchaeales archaeon]
MSGILFYFFPSEIKSVLWRPMTIVGLPGSGKTNLALYLAREIRKRFPGETSIIYTN